MFTGLGDWTGIEIQTLGIPNVPEFLRPDIYDVLWSVPLGLVCALAAFGVRLCARRVLAAIRGRPALIPVAGACVGAAACAYAVVTGHPPDEALFSGQETIGTLVGEPGHWTEAELALLAACHAFGYAVSLAAFRGGPIFPPAVLLGVAFGVLLDGLPGLGRTPAIAIGMAAIAAAMLRLPLSAIVLVTLLLGPADIGVVPLAILSAIAAFVVTELIDPPTRASSGR